MSAISLELVEAHARDYFKGHRWTATAWALGPTARLFPESRALCFGPGPRTSGFAYVSIGGCNVRDELHREFVLCAPFADASFVELMAMVLFYHHTEYLDVGHTVPIGRPWCEGGTCDSLLVSLPYPFGRALEELSVDGHEVRFLWLMPIYASESRFRHSQGLEALEERFEAQAVDYLNPKRKPVA